MFAEQASSSGVLGGGGATRGGRTGSKCHVTN